MVGVLDMIVLGVVSWFECFQDVFCIEPEKQSLYVSMQGMIPVVLDLSNQLHRRL